MSERVQTEEELTGAQAEGEAGAQTADTPGNDENGDGVKGGQATADTVGDVLGL